MYTNIAQHEDWFTAYAVKYCRLAVRSKDPAPLHLKTRHSYAVLAHARTLVQTESFAPEIARACLLSALYHDVARFPQYIRYNTFKDSLSTNHGLWGTRILKKRRRFADELPRVRGLTLAAVALHNRFALPQLLPDDLRCVTDAVRDADKLDILRVIEAHTAGNAKSSTVMLHVPDDPAIWSPKVLDDALNGRVAAYMDLTSVNDFRVLLCSWMYDLRFAATRRALVQESLVPRLLAKLPDTKLFVPVKEHLLQQLDLLPI